MKSATLRLRSGQECKVQSLGSKGLTLIEVLISMSIAVIVGVLLVVIIVNSAGLYSQESSKLSEGLNINDALSQVRGSIKDASAIVASYNSGSTTYTSSATQLVLKMPSIDSSNNIIANTFDYFVFFLDQNKLRFKTFTDSTSFRKNQDQIFSTSVNSLTFQYFNSANPPVEVIPISAARVKVTLTLKQKNGNVVEQKTATTEASLRND